MPLGTIAPSFKLRDTQGLFVSSDQFKNKPLLVVFMCNHCPYVKHVREGLVLLIKKYRKKGLAVVGINSNDAEEYLDDAPEKMLEDALMYG